MEDFVDLWRLKEGHLLLTGSYVQDLEEYPGFWDHDFQVCLSEKQRADRIVQNTLKRSADGVTDGRK